MSEMSTKLLFKKENIFKTASEETLAAIYAYAEGYKTFLDAAKTEREAVTEVIAMVEKAGYKPYEFGDKLEVGGCYYYANRGKSIYVFRIGSADIEKEGVRIVASHIDSPRIDLKQVPVYQDSEMCFFKTHYYGGIKKYQWTALPLALHGVVILADGTKVNICIGEEEGDPIFYINDLLPHLAQDQYRKALGEAIPGENLNILVGGSPLAGEESDAIKLHVLKLLHDKYGIVEADFMSAEISAVPAFKARDIGFDRALIGGYGHDDRVCSYPAITALLETKDSVKTSIVVLADKEEVGSDGNTGMQSIVLSDILDSISEAVGANVKAVRNHSMCLSADVNAAYDPNFREVYEHANSAILSCGTTLSKFTGSRGKAGSNDASAEFVGVVRHIFDANGVVWQTSELGRVDQGGGGTVAKFISQLNIDTVDLGVPVISMHAPYEVISKADLYMTHRAFCAFMA